MISVSNPRTASAAPLAAIFGPHEVGSGGRADRISDGPVASFMTSAGADGELEAATRRSPATNAMREIMSFAVSRVPKGSSARASSRTDA